MAKHLSDEEILARMHRLAQLRAVNALIDIRHGTLASGPEAVMAWARKAATGARSRAVFYLEEAAALPSGSNAKMALLASAQELIAMALSIELLQPGALHRDCLEYLLENVEAPRDPWPYKSPQGQKALRDLGLEKLLDHLESERGFGPEGGGP